MFDFDVLCTEHPLSPEQRRWRYEAKRGLLKLHDAWHLAFGDHLDADDLIGDWPEVPAALRRQAE
jgi:hypothetical protein